MEHFELCAMRRNRKQILELLQRRGIVELRDLSVDGEVFEKLDTSGAQSLFEKNSETARQAADIVSRYTELKTPALSFLRGRNSWSVQEHEDFCKRRNDVLQQAQDVQAAEREIAEAKAEILRYDLQVQALEPWLDLPVAQTFSGTRKTAVFIGSLEGEFSVGEILEQLAEAAPELDTLHVEVVSTPPMQTNLCVIAMKRQADEAEEALRQIGFARPASATHRLPKEKRERLLAKQDDAKKRIEEHTKVIQNVGGESALEDFHRLEDHMQMRAEKYAALENLAQSSHTFILEGFVPQKFAASLRKEVEEKFECAVDTYHVGYDNTECPTAVENKWFPRPAETVLESYSLPSRRELDPTPIMSIFYYMMFGLMFSDFGYGLLLAGGTLFCLLKFKGMEDGWKKQLQLFFWCGVSTMFWGVVFSSYFGDVVDVVAKTFFGRAADAESLLPPLWFLPLNDPMRLLMFCLAIGVVHLSVGYVLNGVNSFRRGDYAAVLYDAVFPGLFVYPLVFILLGTEMFAGMLGGTEPLLALPSAVNTALAAIAGVCAVGVIFTGGRESKNWGKRILKGVYALYNVVSGWLSDILSYSRLLALGLATGVIASVMNQLGSMAGGGVVGAILFIIVFAVGQSLNFGINVLGAYVHSNRLEFVEFFGKFYEGGGRKFAPLGIHTKYYKIEEEI